jgi:hypothetical protein
MSLEFSVKPFLKRLVITPIRLGNKISNSNGSGFSLKPFLKRLAVKQFFKKACDHANWVIRNEILVNLPS